MYTVHSLYRIAQKAPEARERISEGFSPATQLSSLPLPIFPPLAPASPENYDEVCIALILKHVITSFVNLKVFHDCSISTEQLKHETLSVRL